MPNTGAIKLLFSGHPQLVLHDYVRYWICSCDTVVTSNTNFRKCSSRGRSYHHIWFIGYCMRGFHFAARHCYLFTDTSYGLLYGNRIYHGYHNGYVYILHRKTFVVNDWILNIVLENMRL